MSKHKVYKQTPSKPTSLLEFLPDVRPTCHSQPATPPLVQSPSTEAAYKEGYAEGYAAGFRQSILDRHDTERESAEAFRRELSALVDRIEAAMSLWYEKAEQSLVKLSMEIAKRLVADELTMRPEVILSIVREAITRVANSNSALIRVNPFDLPALEENKDVVLRGAASMRIVEIVGDDQLERGSVVVETDSGTVDASLNAKVHKLLSGGIAA